MAAPTVSATSDKVSYAPGQPVTVTVSYADPDTKTNVVTITGTDAEGHAATVTLNLSVVDPVSVTLSDDGNHVWTKGADNGASVVFTTTA